MLENMVFEPKIEVITYDHKKVDNEEIHDFSQNLIRVSK
jgi:hypothetical protein